MHSFLMSSINQQEIAALDTKVQLIRTRLPVLCCPHGMLDSHYVHVCVRSQIHDTVEQVNAIKLQREFYLGFAENPQVSEGSICAILLLSTFMQSTVPLLSSPCRSSSMIGWHPRVEISRYGHTSIVRGVGLGLGLDNKERSKALLSFGLQSWRSLHGLNFRPVPSLSVSLSTRLWMCFSGDEGQDGQYGGGKESFLL